MKKILSVIFLIVAAVCMIFAIISISTGFDKKNHYRNYDEYSWGSVNAYVGGDAYNYIINAGYFAGYMALGGCLIISSVICSATGVVIAISKSNHSQTNLPPINEADTRAELPPISEI